MITLTLIIPLVNRTGYYCIDEFLQEWLIDVAGANRSFKIGNHQGFSFQVIMLVELY